MTDTVFTAAPPRRQTEWRRVRGMISTARVCRLAALMACMTAATFLPVRGAPTTDQPEAVTSDTPEYCMHLLDKVSALVRSAPSSPPPEVSSLSTEGEKMCAH